MLWIILLSAIIVGALYAMFVVFAYGQAKEDKRATHVQTGTIKFAVAGQSLWRVLDNLEGHYVDTRSCTVRTNDSPGHRRRRGFLEIQFGIFWISWFYPLRQLHEFEVVADKLVDDEEVKRDKLPVREQIRYAMRKVQFLMWRFPHPLLCLSVELGKDKWKVDILLVLDMRIVNPQIVVFEYGGKVMKPIDAAIEAMVNDYANDSDKDYDTFVKSNKGMTIHPNERDSDANGMDLANRILSLNDATAQGTTPGTAGYHGLRKAFGVEIKAVWLKAYDLSPEQKALNDAAQAAEKEALLAKAEVEKAQGLRQARQIVAEAAKTEERLKGEGIAEGLEAMFKMFIASGMSPEAAAAAVKEQIRTSNLSGLQVYVEGNSSVLPTLPLIRQ